MKTHLTVTGLLVAIFAIGITACTKDMSAGDPSTIEKATVAGNPAEAESNYNLEVVLRGNEDQTGHIHFTQDRDPAKVISLDTKLHNLLANHTYKLQRAVDPGNNVDGNCTSTTWLTLGYGLMAHPITTNEKGDAEDLLWRDVTAIPSGTRFDIHFQVIDAETNAVVLTSDCYQYTVR